MSKHRNSPNVYINDIIKFYIVLLRSAISRKTISLQRARAIRTLRNLDDRQLEDIGISRNDIPMIVEGIINIPERPGDHVKCSTGVKK